MQSLRQSVVLVCALTIAGYHSEAHADSAGTIGAACVPADVDVAANNYETAGFGVRFKGSATGNIRLVCNLHWVEGKWRSLRMTYIDPDGMSTAYRVRVRLMETGGGNNVSTVIHTCDSNTSNTTTPTHMWCDFADFSPNDYRHYWLDVLLERTSTAASPEFLAANLRGD